MDESIVISDVDGDMLVIEPVSKNKEGRYSKGFWLEFTTGTLVFFKLEQLRQLNEACLAAIAHLEALEKDA